MTSEWFEPQVKLPNAWEEVKVRAVNVTCDGYPRPDGDYDGFYDDGKPEWNVYVGAACYANLCECECVEWSPTPSQKGHPDA